MGEGPSEVPKRGQEKLEVPAGLGLELAPLLDTEFVMAQLLEQRIDPRITIESCRVRHLRFHPGKDSLVAYDVKIRHAGNDRAEKVQIFARCESTATFERELRRATNAGGSPGQTKSGRLLDGVLILTELRAMFLEFPHDSRLPHLAVLDERTDHDETESLAEILDRNLSLVVGDSWSFVSEKLKTSVLKYKPERRLVCRCDTSWKVPELPEPLSLAVILRFERRGLARLVGARASRLCEALSRSDRVRSPRLLFADPEHELVGMECIAGRSLADDVQGEDPIVAVEKAADCLAILHRCGAFESDDPETRARLRSSDDSVDLLGYSTENYAKQAKSIQQRLKKLSDKTPAGAFGAVHGDFHQEQILIDDDCDWIVDVEWAGYGDTSLDLGSFFGQLTMLEIRKLIPDADLLQQAFLARYQKHCGEVNRARLACEEVHILLELAGKQFRRLKSSWPKRVGKILDRCDQILEAQEA